MKNLLLIIFAFGAFVNQSYSTTRTVSNNPNIPAEFVNLQEAIDASANGDTLLVHGSPNAYGAVTFEQSLVVIGPGYFPAGQNNLRAQILSATVRAINDGDADNMVFIGMQLDNFLPHGGTGCGQGFGVKVRMDRCFVTQVNPRIPSAGVNDSELIAEQCIFGSTVAGQSTFCGGPGIANMIFNNCVFTGQFQYSNALSSGVVNNCMFLGGGSSLGTIQNTIFANNIFHGTNINAGTITGCTFNSNLTFSTNNNELALAPNVTSNTLVNVNPLFVNAGTPASGQNFTTLFLSTAQNYNLQAASPAINAGSDGTNLGTSGGNIPYNYLTQGSRKGPNMTTLIINNSSLPVDGTLNVNFNARIQD